MVNGFEGLGHPSHHHGTGSYASILPPETHWAPAALEAKDKKNHLCPEVQECLGQQDRVEGVKFLKTEVLRTKIWFSTCVIVFQDKPVWCEFLAAKWRCGHEEAGIKPQTT